MLNFRDAYVYFAKQLMQYHQFTDKRIRFLGGSRIDEGIEIEGGGGGQCSDHSKIASFPGVSFSSRNASSKYDFVKVKVWLGDNADHYYVLSRFLLSRMLTVTKIPNHVAVKIALELKKLLVDNSLLDVSQSDLEANLFKACLLPSSYILLFCIAYLWSGGLWEEYINRYKMMTRFHHQRVPLVILVCGTACVGKSTIATQLAQRLNLPNVLQTEMVYELLRTSTDAPLASIPVWERDFSSPEELVTEFCRECRVAMKDGKPIIIEGIHLDPSIYLMDEENKLEKNKEKSSVSVTSENDPSRQTYNNPTNIGGYYDENGNCIDTNLSSEVKSGDQLNKPLDSQETIDVAESIPDNKGEITKDSEGHGNNPMRKEKSGPEPIIIPIALKMAPFDHKALLDEWISTRMFNGKCQIKSKERLIANLKTIQDYLCSFESQGLTVVNISATTFLKLWIGCMDIFFSASSKAFHQFQTETVSSNLKVRLPSDVSLDIESDWTMGRNWKDKVKLKQVKTSLGADHFFHDDAAAVPDKTTLRFRCWNKLDNMF
ncbi:hypothetical protein K2173_014370 [Erythroxylum novogranatense]|uniref:P-loop containing nucleoside triphosphate hydrolases superfamily protein n=1 Tax=Erythroxylum novogranatense TaxID=1862640 RepID=A0AAV8S7E1_9ROSI|nr:hypothetical protein K2173_014370 [Erythroxylum novogranatense]